MIREFPKIKKRKAASRRHIQARNATEMILKDNNLTVSIFCSVHLCVCTSLSVCVCVCVCVCVPMCDSVCQRSIDELSTMLNGTVLAAETAGPNLRVRDKRPSQLWAGERTSHQRRGETAQENTLAEAAAAGEGGVGRTGGVCERRVAGWNPPALDWTPLPNENQLQKLHNQTCIMFIHSVNITTSASDKVQTVGPRSPGLTDAADY